ncbi:unnamed protein product [Ilex paraguariensis]|uniref:Uncharacterized protein n=1 Tax=Ilex paraguariensis TaxID=185542 RepID=A0ABC8TWH1_9AQUA
MLFSIVASECLLPSLFLECWGKAIPLEELMQIQVVHRIGGPWLGERKDKGQVHRCPNPRDEKVCKYCGLVIPETVSIYELVYHG